MERFWKRVEKRGEAECWPWKGSTDDDGYGWCSAMGEKKAHRVAYVLAYGLVPEGLSVLHSCDNPGCCNYAHLRAGTPADNMRDKVERGRARGAAGEANGMQTRPEQRSAGSRNGAAKLTEADVLRIRERRAAGATVYELAKDFGLSHPTVSNICTRKTWKHVGGPKIGKEQTHAIRVRAGKKAREKSPAKPNEGCFKPGGGRGDIRARAVENLK